jgi:trans-2,3-dihydro-3-hydroxyanthranilate isomerase
MLDYHILDVFTETPFAGNPLAVVLHADALSDRQMLTLAREFNLSETIFVCRPDDPAHDARVRIFFPTAEIPFAGHPTIGCAVLLAGLARPAGVDFDTVVTLEEQAGLVPVRVVRRAGAVTAELTAPVLPHPHPGRAPLPLVAEALGLAAREIGFPGHAPALWAGGPAFLFVPVADAGVLAMARVCQPAWSRLMQEGGVEAAFLYTPGLDLAEYRCRMFSPGAGIGEDPATGSAAALLSAQLLAAGALAEGTTRLRLVQGVEMGRPSRIGLSVDRAGGAIRAVRVAGAAVAVAQGRIAVPPVAGHAHG